MNKKVISFRKYCIFLLSLCSVFLFCLYTTFAVPVDSDVESYLETHEYGFVTVQTSCQGITYYATYTQTDDTYIRVNACYLEGVTDNIYKYRIVTQCLWNDGLHYPLFNFHQDNNGSITSHEFNDYSEWQGVPYRSCIMVSDEEISFNDLDIYLFESQSDCMSYLLNVDSDNADAYASIALNYDHLNNRRPTNGDLRFAGEDQLVYTKYTYHTYFNDGFDVYKTFVVKDEYWDAHIEKYGYVATTIRTSSIDDVEGYISDLQSSDNFKYSFLTIYKSYMIGSHTSGKVYYPVNSELENLSDDELQDVFDRDLKEIDKHTLQDIVERDLKDISKETSNTSTSTSSSRDGQDINITINNNESTSEGFPDLNLDLDNNGVPDADESDGTIGYLDAAPSLVERASNYFKVLNMYLDGVPDEIWTTIGLGISLSIGLMFWRYSH